MTLLLPCALAAVQCAVMDACHPADVKHYDSATLRERFVMEEVMRPGELRLSYTMHDRIVFGGAMPIEAPLALLPPEALCAEFFLARRELGVINVGGDGVVSVDGEDFALGFKEALYVGRGKRDVAFRSVDAARPAKFYLNSAPAHREYITQRVAAPNRISAGSRAEANERVINQLIVWPVLSKTPGGGCCQLQMGLTELMPGSVWNTMPQHVHQRRTEVYFYFNLPPGAAVCHQMGEPREERLLWLANEQAVVSPPWSVHSGAGTVGYMFIWGMAGENLDYGDVRKVPMEAMR